jgi:phosphopantetheine adenylyltransferase
MSASTKTPQSMHPNQKKYVSIEDYRILVQEVDFRKTEIRINDKIDTVKTDLTKEITAVRTDLTKEITAVRTELKETEIRLNTKIDTVKTDLTKEITAVRTDLTKEITAVRTDLTKAISEVASSVEKLGTGIYRALFGAVVSIVGIIGAVVYSHPDGRSYLADIIRGESRK